MLILPMVLVTLMDISQKVNKDLPVIYDSVTKLTRTTVENDYFIYHYLVDGNKPEFDRALPMVKGRITKSICTDRVTKTILVDLKKSIVYRYENPKGISLGQFMVSPDHCRGGSKN